MKSDLETGMPDFVTLHFENKHTWSKENTGKWFAMNILWGQFQFKLNN